MSKRGVGVLGPQRGSVLAAAAAIAGLVAWGLLTWWTRGGTWRDPTLWQLILFTSVILDVLLLLECEWACRGIPPRHDGVNGPRALAWWAVAELVGQGGLALALIWRTEDYLFIAAGLVVLANLLLARLLAAACRAAAGVAVNPDGLGIARSGTTESFQDGPAAEPPPYVIACSGGGIRASAFVLGGINALQAAAAQPWRSATTPRFVAVSGGSYTAAAIALTSTFTVNESSSDRREETVPWTDAYRLETPEMQRLRRHTRDLLEPRSQLVLGLAALLLGAALNVFLALAALRLVAWAIAWFSTRAGDLRLDGPCDRGLCSVFDGWGGRSPWWTDETVTVWFLLTIVTVVAGVALWVVQGRINRLRTESIDRGTLAVPILLSRLRSATQYAATAWFVALILLPGLVASLNHLALDNSPTPGVASVVSGLGFSTPDQCAQAGGRSMVRAVTEAAAAARISPGEARSAHGGACGVDTEVTLTVQATASTCSVSPGSSTCPTQPQAWNALGADLVRSELGGGGGIRSLAKIGGSLVAFLTLLQTLRASVTAGDVAGGAGGGRLKRFLLMRLPIAVVGLVTVWLLARWIFQAAVEPVAMHSWVQIALPLGALVAAIFLDANVTSMHEFYRGRLASAFAVGRTTDGSAAELDRLRFYRFSELNDFPLTIATTANVQAYASVPTRRGGAPLTFDNRNVTLHSGSEQTSRTVAVDAYEEAVGYGYASIMSIVAMSGAAVSPMMGRFAATFGPFRILLALFNIRVGVWVPNPRYAPPEEMTGRGRNGVESLRQWPVRPWLSGRPGAAQVAMEAFGKCSFDDQWLYLTDGGHLDNTGLVEAVRVARAQRSSWPSGFRYVVVLDASNDKEGTWAAVGDALAVIRADLGINLVRVAEGERTFGTDASIVPAHPVRSVLRRPSAAQGAQNEPDFARGYTDVDHRLRVLVVKAVRPLDLEHADMPDSVRAFALSTPDFPRASTSRQDFSDLEFEAYRALGEWCAGRSIDRVWADA